MGGSVRIPAAFCGVVGSKPSLGRIPMTILPSVFDNISHFGPLARSVGDAVAFMQAASGASDEDISSVPLDFSAALVADGSIVGKRLALSIDLGYYEVQPQVEAELRAAVERLQRAGAVVDELPMRWTRAVNDQWFDLWCVFMAAFFADRLALHRDRMDPAVVAIIDRGLGMNTTAYKRIELLRTGMWRDLAELFRSYDALLCPTCAVTAPGIADTYDDYVSDSAAGRYRGLDMTCPFNLVPQCPAISVPIGFASDGLPVGLQIVGPPYRDETLLALALRA
ncbi:amidase [Sinorhizobium fredii]|uniref:amidase n=1 Tax=Rhizobium fredii TaxID=380 RepID=UPI00069485C5|nr:amidase [Sinorhizobium fredii]WOS66035.1 amidase [Sinorhizobium fredii GR64]